MSRHPDKDLDPGRREFLIRSGRYLGAAALANTVSNGFHLSKAFAAAPISGASPQLQVHPRYRKSRPLDSLLQKIQPGLDEYPTERYAADLSRILKRWTGSVVESIRNSRALATVLASSFRGALIRPTSTQTLRQDGFLQITACQFPSQLTLSRDEFISEWAEALGGYDTVLTFETQIVQIDAQPATDPAESLLTRIRYELVAAGNAFYREQKVGEWEVTWKKSSAPASDWVAQSWRAFHETQSRSSAPGFLDIAASALGSNASWGAQLTHGADYWRSVMDAASGIDIYGHNGVSLGDLHGDGYDDLYICQGAGLPNRLYRNRGDGTFEDATEKSGLGILENTACALIVDVDNDGLQDVIVVCASGPQLYRNQGHGRFRKQANAFQFAHPPQGTFTGAAAADYDRDGWLDVYFCLYVYYQGSEQYKYPLPYYDAENGPPNFLFRNNRDGTFRDVTEQSGLNAGNTRYSFCCGWSDYDRDGLPDLYVVNDFGRKNLYRNNGDGTFTDASKHAEVEDTGAGMSVCWLDVDNDGLEDLYVANMWTAAGMRVAATSEFQKSAPSPSRAQYQKHAMGNSLFHNRGDESFTDETNAASVAMGRWSWSSDSWDFDHDGYPDLYVTNGMVTGPSREDLNSFFWRQVIAKSPNDSKPTPAYEQGWNAINEALRADGTWSGYERNVFFANNHNGGFSDVSGCLGIDFVEDGRSFALSDFDGDGRQEVFLKNRNAPQLRLLKNVLPALPPAIAFRLRGTKSNRDAIGARVTLHTEAGQQTRWLQAGSGFLSQHSKEVFFGLGTAKGSIRATIQWPSGLIQQFSDLPPNHRIWVEEGNPAPRTEAFRVEEKTEIKPARSIAEVLPENIQTWLLAPIAAPDFVLPDARGKQYQLSKFNGRPVVLHFWAADSEGTEQAIKSLNRLSTPCLAICTDQSANKQSLIFNDKIPVLQADADVVGVYNILWTYLFDRHRDLPLPATFLLNAKLEIEKVYQGSLDIEVVERDLRSMPKDIKDRLRKGLPFDGVIEDAEFRRNYLSYGSIYFQRGYFEQAQASFQHALADDPNSAEALYGLGSSMLQLGKATEARQNFERATAAKSSYPDTLPNAWNNLGLLATQANRMEEALQYFQRALDISPNHLVALNNLGNAYRNLRNWTEAESAFEHAVQVDPDDADAHYGLGMVLAQTGRSENALAELQRALKIRPDSPDALNNLGVLFLNLQRVDDAIHSFQECIRVAPGFEQSYLNLAKVYALQKNFAAARETLQQLLVRHPEDEQAKTLLEQLPK